MNDGLFKELSEVRIKFNYYIFLNIFIMFQILFYYEMIMMFLLS